MSILLTRHAEHPQFAVMTIARPEALNALSFALIEQIGACLEQVAESDARALLIIGAGPKAFCAGADIAELRGRSMQAQRRGAERGQQVFSRLDTLPMPSIAVINGYAFGGGLELALACTFRLAAATAKMGLPEIKLGLIPGYGGTQRLPRLIGEARAMDMILTGRTVTAQEALACGLVNRIADDDPLAAAVGYAQEFAGYSPLALQWARSAVQRSLQGTLQEGLKAEADLSTLAFRTDDAAEGMQAFIEKRPPQFSGK